MGVLDGPMDDLVGSSPPEASGDGRRQLAVVVDRRPGGFAQPGEQRVQLLAFVGAQRGEERVLGVAERLIGLSQAASAGRGDGDDVTASVDGVSLALDEPRGFQWVEQTDEDAVVDAHELGQLPLPDRAAVMQQVEDAQLAWLEVVLGEHLPDVAREALAQDGQRDAGA